jgi:type IX secretion system PorP/SprF family membrane protein
MYRTFAFAGVLSLMAALQAGAQGLQFSQLHGMPMLTSVANTGLMTEDDYRINVQYRNQWGAVPVPFNTFAVAVDGQALRNSRVSNWLGFGAVVFSDRAGEGGLSMTRIQLNAAYHLSLGKRQLLSVGLGAANISRRVNISQLVFDAQWDGFAFDPNTPNLEPNQGGRASYLDLSTGVNYIYFPNKYSYVKGSVGVEHLNHPVESVFRSGNVVKPRTHAIVDVGMLLENGMLFNPSVYFTTQQQSWQAMIGANMTIPLFDNKDSENVIIGLYHRVRDAVVIMAGYEYKQLRFTASYDYTVSDIGQYINHNGAFELGFIYHRKYPREGKAKNIEAPSSGELAPTRMRLR